jgi:putative transposase
MVARARNPAFSNQSLAVAVVDCLKTCCARSTAHLLMYCAMPDHVHALIKVEEVDFISIIHDFKSYTTRLWWKHGGEGKLWQRSAYDRGIRQPEYMDDLIRYIFDNPVDWGEIESWIESGLIGGSVIDEGA